MNEKEEMNITLPVILVGILSIGLFVYFIVSNNEMTPLSVNIQDSVKQNLTASVVHFTAPDRVIEGDTVEFSWKAGVSENAICVGKTEPEGSEGGWIGSKKVEGTQNVGPIERNTTYFLDCTDGEKMLRDVELVSVVKPNISFLANKTIVSLNESVGFSWDAINVKGCKLDSEGKILAEGVNGAYSISGITKSTTYTLSCDTATQPISETIEIVVEE